MVDIIHWNPKRSIFKKKPFSYLPIKKKVNNFGDLLGPLVVESFLEKNSLINNDCNKARLLTVGSILHFANNNDVVWGSGRNGKIDDKYHVFDKLDVRSVRGPLTREFLQDKGINCPDIYGDPALLLPYCFPELVALSKIKKYEITKIPNLNDFANFKLDINTLNPTMELFCILKRIVQSKFVIGSSLHAIIVAEAFGVPARLINSSHEDRFKYDDYFLGTGRNNAEFASTIEEAISMGGEMPIQWNEKALIESFPIDLWTTAHDA